MTRPLHVVVAGGGTAGHVEPALAVADALRALDDCVTVSAVGTASGLEARLVPGRGYELALIPKVPLPRRPTADLLRVPGRLAGAIDAVEQHLIDVDAAAVVGFGGYVALPAYLAARRLDLPFVVHEANVRPGLANRIGARLTPHVAVAVEGTGLRDAQVVGIPLREQISSLDRPGTRAQARLHFGLPADGPVLLVFGGSQGAQRINNAVCEASGALAAAGVSVLHVAGPVHAEGVRAAVGNVPAHVVLDYVDRMDLAYAAADLAVCRAGAMTCAEVAAVGLPALFVPLPIGNGEQSLNARPLVEAGAAMLVPDTKFDTAVLTGRVLSVLGDPAALTKMAAASQRTGSRDADTVVARLVLDAATHASATSRRRRR